MQNDLITTELVEELLARRRNFESKLSLSRYCKNKGLNASDTKLVMKLVESEICDLYIDENASLLNESMMKLELLSEIAFARKDYKLALECQKEINKISGLHREKIEISGKIGMYVAKFGSDDSNITDSNNTDYLDSNDGLNSDKI